MHVYACSVHVYSCSVVVYACSVPVYECVVLVYECTCDTVWHTNSSVLWYSHVAFLSIYQNVLVILVLFFCFYH